MMPTVLIFTLRRFSRSRMKSNIAWLKWPSCGEVRKNHLSPRSVSAGDDDSALRCGTPLRSATWATVCGHAGEVGAEQRVHLFLGDQPLGLGLAEVGLALVVDDDDAGSWRRRARAGPRPCRAAC